MFNHNFLNQWNVNSKLLAVLRQMHAEFEANPPQAEGEAQQPMG
jgi:hypothetical protein